MKKILSLMVVFMLIFAMTGCSSKPAEPAADAEKPAEPAQAESTATEPVASTIAPEDLTVGFIYVGPIGDGGYTYAHDQGRLYLEEKLGVKTIYKESVPETQEVEQEIRNMVDQGAKVIFATSFGHMDYTEKMSKEFPEVAFFHCSGYKTTENMSSYFGRMYEARYLSGIVAGMKTETDEIGYVAAFAIPEVIRGINAFTLGVQSVNPDATVKVVWTSTWYDPAKEKEAAISLLDQGVDIIAQHQDTTGPQQAAEERGAFSIGYNTDMSTMAPKAYMTAPVWNWGPYYTAQVQSVLEGTFKSEAYWGGMEDDVVKLAPLTENAPAGAGEAVDAATAKILDGSLVVFTGPILNQAGEVAVEEGKSLTDEEMLNMMWFVKGVEGKIE
ncbi:BMP family ABC transporter substrate-binding protein [Fusibacter sp. 3D3]|uniref:BMP family ABC transporter substrate-binding protein n=1 Tax=Fusibacter sp. 3D3 TaxID=1048380 RepID=UPI000853C831|nr:BMP family ABC transporter substrate-binding protein [Fusibacter sp. 3D3]GAU78976.1 nucleoside ABC transporter [Fusibacter sp. 3D3]